MRRATGKAANTTGLCLCGCGEPTPLAKSTSRKYGLVKGQPTRYIPGHQAPKPDLSCLETGLKGCSKCGETKPLADFNRHRQAASGYRSYCRECQKAAGADYKPDPAAQRERCRRWYERDPERARARVREYREANPEIVQRQRRALIGNPHHLARKRLAFAVSSGRIERPEVCEDCGGGGPIHGHHHDYTKPYDVEWLCPTCHGRRHRIQDDMSVAS